MKKDNRYGRTRHGAEKLSSDRKAVLWALRELYGRGYLAPAKPAKCIITTLAKSTGWNIKDLRRDAIENAVAWAITMYCPASHIQSDESNRSWYCHPNHPNMALDLEEQHAKLSAKINTSKTERAEIGRDNLIAGLQFFRTGDIKAKSRQSQTSSSSNSASFAALRLAEVCSSIRRKPLR